MYMDGIREKKIEKERERDVNCFVYFTSYGFDLFQLSKFLQWND